MNEAIAWRLKRLRAQLPADLDDLRRLPVYAGEPKGAEWKLLYRDLHRLGARSDRGVWTLDPAKEAA